MKLQETITKPLGTQDLVTMMDRDDMDPEEIIEQTRRQAVLHFKTTGEHEETMTIHLLLKMCLGLIKTNQEIWDRCKPFCCTKLQADDDATKDKFIFYRVQHSNVRTHYRVPCFGGSMENEELILKSDPNVTKQAFRIPTSLPASLESLIPTPTPDRDNVMPNYGAILWRSILLIDDLAFSFLHGFKAFLENHQLALGQVDAWLFDKNEHELFLEDQFGVKVPSNDDPTWHQLFAGCPSAASICGTYHKCSRCGKRFEFHKMNAMDDWVTCPTDHRPGCFPLQK